MAAATSIPLSRVRRAEAQRGSTATSTHPIVSTAAATANGFISEASAGAVTRPQPILPSPAQSTLYHKVVLPTRSHKLPSIVPTDAFSNVLQEMTGVVHLKNAQVPY